MEHVPEGHRGQPSTPAQEISLTMPLHWRSLLPWAAAIQCQVCHVMVKLIAFALTTSKYIMIRRTPESPSVRAEIRKSGDR